MVRRVLRASPPSTVSARLTLRLRGMRAGYETSTSTFLATAYSNYVRRTNESISQVISTSIRRSAKILTPVSFAMRLLTCCGLARASASARRPMMRREPRRCSAPAHPSGARAAVDQL
jgi:hypothetical protein